MRPPGRRRRPAGWLDTATCAAELGVTTDFMRGEIRDGRLAGFVLARPGKRALYRVREADFAIYREKHWRRIRR